MAPEVPRPIFRQYSTVSAVQLCPLEENLVGYLAVDASALAVGE